MINFGEGVVIVFVIALVFGAKRLPHIGQSIGQAVKNYKRASRGDDEITVAEIQEIPPKPEPPKIEPKSEPDPKP